MIYLFVLAMSCSTSPDSSADSEALQDEDCLRTYGDNCGCDAQCLTAEQVAEIQSGDVCDPECGSPDWGCLVYEGQCTKFFFD